MTTPVEFVAFIIGNIIPEPENTWITGWKDDLGWMVLVFPDQKMWPHVVGKVGYTIDTIKYLTRMYAAIHGEGVVKLSVVHPETDAFRP